MTYRIEPIQIQDAPQAAEIHAEGQEHSFLTSMGPGFLLAMYREMILSSDCLGYVALADQEAAPDGGAQSEPRQVVGVVVGTTDPDGFLGDILRSGWWRLAPSVLGALLRRPMVIRCIVETLLYPGQALAEPGEAELLFIGTRMAWRRQGVGAALYRAFANKVEAQGATAFGLTVDDALQDAMAYHLGRGLRPRRQFTLYGRRMHWLSKPLGAAASPPPESKAGSA